jgi:hypothetical protein
VPVYTIPWNFLDVSARRTLGVISIHVNVVYTLLTRS